MLSRETIKIVDTVGGTVAFLCAFTCLAWFVLNVDWVYQWEALKVYGLGLRW